VFFDGWSGLVRVLVVGACAYVGLVALLRVFGKRTLAKMNAFDLVVTVALGSTLATVLLSEDVALAEGVLAFALLCSLQFVVTAISLRSRRFRETIKAEPRLLLLRGEMLRRAMRSERVGEEEVTAAIRSAGFVHRDQVEAVVLETDGTFSVVGRTRGGGGGATDLPDATDARSGMHPPEENP
jgi:uncharacterized membrane protein YcaP (DUF421 family)